MRQANVDLPAGNAPIRNSLSRGQGGEKVDLPPHGLIRNAIGRPLAD